MSEKAGESGGRFWGGSEADALQRCQSLVETFGDGLWRLDADGRLVAVDDGLVELTGYARDDLLGAHLSVLLEEASADRLEGIIQGSRETDVVDTSYEITVCSADGGRIPCELHVDPVEDGGSFEGTVGVVRDISERKAAQRTLEESAQRYRALVEHFPNGTVNMFDEDLRYTAVGGQLLEELDIDPSDRICHRIPEIYPDEVVTEIEPYFRAALEGETNSFEIEFRGRHLQAHTLPVGGGSEGDAGMLVVQDVTERKADQRRLEESEQRYRTLVEHFPNGVVALVDEDLEYRTVGGNPRAVANLTPEEVEGQPVGEIVPSELAAELVPRYEAALEGEASSFEAESNDRIFQFQVVPVRDRDGDVFAALGMSQDITEHVETKRELAESERRYRALVENFPNGSVGLFDEDLLYTAVGGELLDTVDVAPEDRIGRSIREIHPDDLLAEIEPYFRAALEGETSSFEVEYRGRHLRAHTHPVGDADDGAAGMVVVQDITERREIERDLRESEARFRMIAESLEEIVWMATPDATEFIYLNPAFETVWGIDRDRLYEEPRSFLEAVHEHDREGVRTQFDALPTSEFDEEFRIVRPDGEVRWVHARGREVTDGEMTRIVGIGQDITERKRQERELGRALDLLERTERVADVGGWEIDVETQDVFWTDNTFELLGVEGDEEPPLEAALDMYHDADQRVVEAAVEAALESGEPFDEEARVQRAGGETRWLRLQGVPETEDGDVVSFRGAAQDVTERKLREQRLEESEARFRMLAESLEEMVWISDPETREILYLNPAYEEIWERDRAEIREDPRAFLETVHPADRERVERAYAAVPAEGFEEEYRIVRPDGEVRWLDVRADAVHSEGRDRVVGIAEDVTQRKERERALEESEQRYRTLAENFPNGAVGLFDEDLEYTAVGGELLDATGVDPEDRIGSSVYDIYPDDIVAEVAPYFEAALEGEANSFETEFHERHLRAHTHPVMDADGEVDAGMLVVQDITEQRKYERQLEESNERLEQFAYAASHDLQEPLRMVSSYLQLIERRYVDELDEEAEEYIEFAVDGADRMRQMVDGLLQYSRVDTRGNPFESVGLDVVLADVEQDLEVKIEETDAEITAEDLPRVYGDPSQLHQVFQNLLDNAIEYSGDAPPEIHVDVEEVGDRWIVSVSDQGIGIDPEDAEKVFEVFESLQGHRGGTGIGLALCERIVERHGGDIWVESEGESRSGAGSSDGGGTTFSFTLPASGQRET